MDILKQVLVAIGTVNLLVHFSVGVKYSSSDGYGAAGSQSKKLPVILMHKQAMSHDGTFNLAFAGDNGIQQGETIHPDGTRIGAYSYVDPNGETISVEYRADKDGFKIMRGDHIPKMPIASASYTSPQYGSSSAVNVQSASGNKYPSSSFGGGGGGSRSLSSSSLTNQLSAAAAAASSDEHFDDFGLGPTGSYSHYRGKVNTNFRPAVYRVYEEASGENYPQAAPSYATLRHREASVNDGGENRFAAAAADSNKPHSFGNGYSFEFGATTNES